MRFIALILAGLLGLVAPALAVNRFVSVNGTATWSNATAWGSPATTASLQTARTNATAGDVVYFEDGNYVSAGSLIPSNSGTVGNRITFIGNPTNPTNVTISNITLAAADYITFRGFKVNSGINMSGTQAGSSPPFATGSSVGDSVVQCISLSSVLMNASWGCVFADNTVGVPGGYGVVFEMVALPIGQTLHCPDAGSICTTTGRSALNTVERNTFNLGVNVSPSGYSWETAYADRDTFRNNRIFMIYGPNADQSHFTNNYTMQGCYFSGNYWSGKNLGGAGQSDRYIFALRDSSRFNTWVRDTFVTDPASTQTTMVQLGSSGTVTGAGTTGYITLDSCFIQITGTFRSQVKTKVMTISNSILIFSNGLISPITTDSLIFKHNTVYKTGTGWLWDNGLASDLNNGTVLSNIFAMVQSPGTAHRWMKNTGSHNFNFNLAYCFNTPGDSTRAIANTAGAAMRMGPSSTWCTVDGNDCNSRWGNPRFADAGSGNFMPTSGTLADFGPDGYVGAIQFGEVPPGDTDPPATVNDLSGSALGPTRVNITWTAPGDDNYTGSPVSVVLKRATSQITNQTQFNAATTIVTLTGGALSTGGEQQTYADNTAAAATSYWYAVQATDDATPTPNVSGISNSVNIITPSSPDVTAPSPVSTLAAFVNGATSIVLIWTSVGDNGTTGTALNYRLKRRVGSTFVLGDSAAATAVPCNFLPKVAGSTEFMVVSGLSPSTQYAFALWVADAAGNVSTISNAATQSTTAVPSLPVAVAGNSRRRRR